MPPPRGTPVGLQVARTGRAVSRAFDRALAEAGGSLPLWLVLTSLKAQPLRTQLELAHAMGIEGPTVTRHLDGFEAAGYVKRVRDRDDRRAIRVELTPAGERMFETLLEAAIAFNRRLTAGMSEQELKQLQQTLDRLEAGVKTVE
jgi:MarR family transcriptional regulator, transcriptional regulator for hemolysin